MRVSPLKRCKKVVSHRASSLASQVMGDDCEGEERRSMSRSRLVNFLAPVVHLVTCNTFPTKLSSGFLSMYRRLRKA